MYLESVINNYMAYITDAIKQPIIASDSNVQLPFITEEKVEVKMGRSATILAKDNFTLSCFFIS